MCTVWAISHMWVLFPATLLDSFRWSITNRPTSPDVEINSVNHPVTWCLGVFHFCHIYFSHISQYLYSLLPLGSFRGTWVWQPWSKYLVHLLTNKFINYLSRCCVVNSRERINKIIWLYQQLCNQYCSCWLHPLLGYLCMYFDEYKYIYLSIYL